jgi:hypothetical protein
MWFEKAVLNARVLFPVPPFVWTKLIIMVSPACSIHCICTAFSIRMTGTATILKTGRMCQ